MNNFLHSIAIAAWLVSHPVHVTLTSIELVKGTDSLKVYLMMYQDDFLVDYRIGLINAGTESEVNPSEDQIVDYINEKLRITLDNKVLKGKLSDMSIRNNEMHLNLLYKSIRKPSAITFSNRIMTDLYKDQANLVIIKIDGIEEGFKLTPGLTEQKLIIGKRSDR